MTSTERMRTLAVIDRSPNVPHEGKLVCREAVRAVIIRGSQLLLIHSKVDGDYKFPGGGVEKDECHTDALIREVAEESGGRIVSTPEPFGKVLEFDFPIEPCYTTFCMTSYYYRCQVDKELGKQKLDEYEARLGFSPSWVEIASAIRNNRDLLASGGKVERWVRRETRVLELVQSELLK